MSDNDEKKIINALKEPDNGSQSMRVVGRGTLVMDAKDVRNSRKYKELLNKADKFIAKNN